MWANASALISGEGIRGATGLRERGNDTSRSTGRSGRQNAATRRNMRRDERVTVQGPVKKQQPDGMSHRGGGGRHEGGSQYLPITVSCWSSITTGRRVNEDVNAAFVQAACGQCVLIGQRPGSKFGPIFLGWGGGSRRGGG